MRQSKNYSIANANARERSRGFALVGILIFIPVISILFGLHTVGKWMVEYTDKQSACENYLFNLQQNTADELNLLFALNKPAYALKVQQKLALLMLMAAIATNNPYAIARAEQNWLKIQQKKQQLERKQNVIITRMKVKLSRDELNTRRKLIRNSTAINIPNTKIRPEDSSETASPYETLPNFSDQQTATAHYVLNLKLPHERLRTKNFTCSATIENRSGTFRAALRPGATL